MITKQQKLHVLTTIKNIFFMLPMYLFADPNAGAIMQQLDTIQKNQIPTNAPQPLTNDTPQVKSKSNPNAQKVLVKGFKITGNTLIPSDKIQAHLARFINQSLSFEELQDVAATISIFYRDSGYSARAFLPPQEINGGIVEIIILEGKLSDIVIDSNQSTRLKPFIAKSLIEDYQKIGEPLSLNKLERGLLLLNDNPGITAESSLEAGDSAGDSVLKLKMQDTALVDGYAIASNYGAKSTGIQQYTIGANLNSPLQIGDQLSATVMATSGIKFGKLSYTIPVGYTGVRAGINGSAMSYQTVGSFSSTGGEGASKTLEINTFYPLIRSKSDNLNIGITLDDNLYRNSSLGIVTSNYKNQKTTIPLTYNMFDTSGSTSLGFTPTFGQIIMSNQTQLTSDQSTKGSNGYFSKYAFNASRNQLVPYVSDTALSLSFSGQLSNKNLDSSEMFYLGGPFGVRAYPANEAGGDEGMLANIELKRNIQSLALSTFYDYGRIIQHYKVYAGWQGSNPNMPNVYSLQGFGVSAGYSYGQASIKGTLAWKIGSNQGAQANGTNNDGTNNIPQAWVQFALGF